MRKKFYLIIAGALLSTTVINAQNTVKDHEGNEYEVSKLSDGRNWMMEGLRVKTNRAGNPIQYYWNDHNGAQTEQAAAIRYGYAYTVEALFGGPAKKDPDFSNRSQGLCPNGYYVPEWWADDNVSREGDWQKLIRAYNGQPVWWSEDANWGDFMHALRISLGDGTIATSGSADGDPGKFTFVDGKLVITGWSHLHSSGPVSWDNLMWLNLPTSEAASTAGGYEGANSGAAYCRCVENFKVNVSFQDFTDMSVIVKLSDSLKWNSYDDRDEFTKICAKNFYIENTTTKTPVEILDIQTSSDAKTFQIFADFNTNEIYELKFFDARLNAKKVPFGGYTFNEGKRLYFPKSPLGVNSTESLILNFSVQNNALHITTDRLINASIIDVSGNTIMKIPHINGFESINIISLSQGMYLLHVYDPFSKSTAVYKFII